MRFRSRNVAIAAAMIGLGGLVFSGPGTSCSSYMAETALTSADFCFIFDCQNGVLGGVFDPCSPLSETTVESQTALPLFTDCRYPTEEP